MWLTNLWWLFDSIFCFFIFRSFSAFLSFSFFFLFGEALFFAKLLDVYSEYVFDTLTLFACLVTSVDEELRCFSFVLVVRDDREIVWRFLTQVHIPKFKKDVLVGGIKTAEFFCKIDGSVFNLMANSVAFVGIWRIRDSSSPSFFFKGGSGCWFYFSVCCISHL